MWKLNCKLCSGAAAALVVADDAGLLIKKQNKLPVN
jgi:hypothetical protein